MPVYTAQTWTYWLVPVNLTGIPGQQSTPQTIEVVGPDGTYDIGPPGNPLFDVEQVSYGAFRVYNVSFMDAVPPNPSAYPDAGNDMGIDEFHVAAAYVDEITDNLYATIGEAIGTLSPYDPGADYIEGIPITYSPDAIAAGWTLSVGDFIVMNDPSLVPDYDQTIPPPGFNSFECGQITGPGDPGDPITTTMNLQRRYPGELPGGATFGSYLTAHASGINIYLLQIQHFPFKVALGAFLLAPGAIPPIFDCAIDNAMVVSVLCGAHNYYGWSGFPYVNLSQPPYFDDSQGYTGDTERMGLRTLFGDEISFSILGTLEVGTTQIPPYLVAFDQVPRVLYAQVGTPSAGADIQINIRVSYDGGATWTTLLGDEAPYTFDIPAGQYDTYGSEAQPPDAMSLNCPYGMVFPFPRFPTGCLLTVDIVQVGSSNPGADLHIMIAT